MEQLIEELKRIIQFKDETQIGDVVLIVNEAGEEDQPPSLLYAVITDFVRDQSKRDEWYYVHLALLSVPPQPQVLILEPDQFNGRLIFTIGGKKVFIKPLELSGLHEKSGPDDGGGDDQDESGPGGRGKGGLRVVK
jgi:hypothetical protein